MQFWSKMPDSITVTGGGDAPRFTVLGLDLIPSYPTFAHMEGQKTAAACGSIDIAIHNTKQTEAPRRRQEGTHERENQGHFCRTPYIPIEQDNPHS